MPKEIKMSVAEVAVRIGTADRTVGRYIKAGKLKAAIELNDRNQKRYLVTEKDLASFLAYKDKEDRLLNPGNSRVSDSKTGRSTGLNEDRDADKHSDTPTDSPVVVLLKGQITELKETVLARDEKIDSQEQDIRKYAFQLGQAETELRLLKGPTMPDTDEDSQADIHPDISGNKKIQPVISRTLMWTLSVLVVLVFIGIVIVAILRNYSILSF
jgi:hypothetical protein